MTWKINLIGESLKREKELEDRLDGIDKNFHSWLVQKIESIVLYKIMYFYGKKESKNKQKKQKKHTSRYKIKLQN